MEIDDPFGTPRTPLAEARPFVGEASLTMDPFGAAYEASDMPLNTADLVTPAASPIDVPVEMPVEMPVDDDPAEMASESDETSMDTTGDTTGDTIAADGYAAEFDDDGWTAVAASMVQAAESTVDSTDESTGESTSALGEFSESTDEFGEALDEFGESTGESFVETSAVDLEPAHSDPFGFGTAPMGDPAETADGYDSDDYDDGLAPLEPSPFGIAVPSIDDLLATVSGEPHDFPAGDGWREVHSDTAPFAAPSAEDEASTTIDEFDALSTAFGVTTPASDDDSYAGGTETGTEALASEYAGDDSPAALRFDGDPEPATEADVEWFTPFDQPGVPTELTGTDSHVLETLGAEIDEQDEYAPSAPVYDEWIVERACRPTTCRPTTCRPTTCRPTTCQPRQSRSTTTTRRRRHPPPRRARRPTRSTSTSSRSRGRRPSRRRRTVGTPPSRSPSPSSCS